MNSKVINHKDEQKALEYFKDFCKLMVEKLEKEGCFDMAYYYRQELKKYSCEVDFFIDDPELEAGIDKLLDVHYILSNFTEYRIK